MTAAWCRARAIADGAVLVVWMVTADQLASVSSGRGDCSRRKCGRAVSAALRFPYPKCHAAYRYPARDIVSFPGRGVPVWKTSCVRKKGDCDERSLLG